MFKLFSLNFQQRAYLVAGVCALGIVTATLLQHLLGWQPCPLCILQRLALVGTGLFALLAALLAHHARTATTVRLLATSAATGGMYAAYEQLVLLWGQHQASCGMGLRMTLLQIVDRMPALAWLLEGPADCAGDPNRVLGMPLAFWVLLLLAGCAAVLWLPRRIRKRSS